MQACILNEEKLLGKAVFLSVLGKHLSNGIYLRLKYQLNKNLKAEHNYNYNVYLNGKISFPC